MLCYNRLKFYLKPISFTFWLREQCFDSDLLFSLGSFSRSAVNYNAGAKTAVSNIVMASAVLVTLLFLMPLFYYTPNVILAAIILTAVIGLIDYQAAYKLWKVDKFDFFTCLCSFFGVLFVSVPLGLAIAVSIQLYLKVLVFQILRLFYKFDNFLLQVGVSVIKILLHVTRPNTLEFGNIPGTQIYQSLGRYREASRIPGFLILAVESPIYFANSTYLQERSVFLFHLSLLDMVSFVFHFYLWERVYGSVGS